MRKHISEKFATKRHLKKNGKSTYFQFCARCIKKQKMSFQQKTSWKLRQIVGSLWQLREIKGKMPLLRASFQQFQHFCCWKLKNAKNLIFYVQPPWQRFLTIIVFLKNSTFQKLYSLILRILHCFWKSSFSVAEIPILTMDFGDFSLFRRRCLTFSAALFCACVSARVQKNYFFIYISSFLWYNYPIWL